MEAHGEPASKRRKLSKDVEPSPPLPTAFSSYIVIARAKVTALSTELDLDDTTESALREINLKNIIQIQGGHEISVTVGRGVRPSHVWVDGLASRDLQILEDARKLESVARYKSPTALPLACYYCTIRKIDELVSLEVCILWHNTVSIRAKVDPALLEIFARYLPPTNSVSPEFEPWEPRQFYDNVHVPSKSEENSAELNVPDLKSKLFRFQRRAVRWLLSREGMVEEPDGHFRRKSSSIDHALPQAFERLRTTEGELCYVNHVLGVATIDESAVTESFAPPKGGILADEMGLGKTLEIIALMCLHPRPPNPTDSSSGLLRSSATLIITPPSILQQWKDEIQEHAPSLRVYHYQGASEYKKSGDALIERLLNHDVILTTYNVIAKEVHHIAEKPDRNLRNKKKREAPAKSPLTQISWWRTVLDEAQMVETGVSAAATVARLIPRKNAWAVTGTPLRKGHRDLYGLLLFLRYSPWSQSTRLWDYLVTYHRPLFREMLGVVAMRQSKDYVREDLRLPPQSRHTITIPFTPVEEQHYAQLFQEFCEDCGLDSNGAPLEGDWDPESPATVEQMRTWLTRLRQTCLHPEVGGRNRRALGRNTNGPLRTVQEVLDVMIDQNEGQLRTAQRSKFSHMVRRGQLKENAKEVVGAIKIWQEALEESLTVVNECKTECQKEQLSSEAKKKDDEEEANTGLNTLKARLRSAMEIHHVITFFLGNGFFQLKSLQDPESDEYQRLETQETQAYEEAKSLRTQLLEGFSGRVNRLVATVRSNLSHGVTQIPVMDEPSWSGGIESRKIFEKLHFYCQAMNLQADRIHELRKKFADFLSKALIDEDEGVELQGDEYESSTKHQDEMYAYMEALRIHVADRAEALTGHENMLIKEEVKQFLSHAKNGEGPAPDLILKLLAEREQTRIKVSELGCLRNFAAEIRQLVSSLQWQEDTGTGNRATQELTILERVLKHVQQLNADQTKASGVFEQEVNRFRDTMNARLEYYRALQKISDQVAPYREESIGHPLDLRLYNAVIVDEVRYQQRIDSLTAKLRYLTHMKTESDSTASRVCVICTDQFEAGIITQCGHTLCKECMLLWLRQHPNCPVCKSRLSASGFHEITYKPAEIAVHAESRSGPTSSSTAAGSDHHHDQSIYSDISATMLNQIKNIEIRGPSYGSKIDFLCRHLLWLRDHDPGSKSIIFSQYREFIDVLSRAFSELNISCTRIDAKNGIERFKADPVIECFLLHAKGQSTGLNLVAASHVFLCEPLVNTAIELQAIARVHRIGQHRPTNVWMYLVGDTIEETIYDISVTRRLAHMKTNNNGSDDSSDKKGKEVASGGASASASARQSGTATPVAQSLQETIIDAANSMELQAADLSRLLKTGKSGGELVDKQDLWNCLFGQINKRRRGPGQNAAAAAAVAALAENQPANTEVGRFLRAEAAEQRVERQAEEA